MPLEFQKCARIDQSIVRFLFSPLLSIVFAMGMALSCYGADPEIGLAKTVKGAPEIIRGNTASPCTENMKLRAGDSVRTPANASVGILLFDGTRLAVGEKSELSIKQFVFEPAEGKFALLVAIKSGVVAYYSGKIGKLSPSSVEIQSPVGMIGTRGTRLAAKIEAKQP